MHALAVIIDTKYDTIYNEDRNYECPNGINY